MSDRASNWWASYLVNTFGRNRYQILCVSVAIGLEVVIVGAPGETGAVYFVIWEEEDFPVSASLIALGAFVP